MTLIPKLTLAALSFVLLASCASTTTSQEWQGRPLHEVVAIYGTPDTYLNLADGEKVVEFYLPAQRGKTANNSSCKATFLIDNNNMILSQSEGHHCL